MAQAASPMPIARELVRLDASPRDKAEAIAQAGQLLAAAGCVEPGYAGSMSRREQAANTFLGHGVAIPHGMGEDRAMVRRNGLAILQVRQGIEWNPGQVAHLIIGIAAASDEHIVILRRLTRLLNDPGTLQALFTTDDPEAILAALGAEPAAAPAAAPATDLAEAFDWVVDYPAGLHARPATRWVEAARATGCRIQVRAGDQATEATALVGLLQLGLRAGDRITVSAEGREAAAALARLRAAITGLSAQEKADAALAAQRAVAPARGWEPAGRLVALAGIGASPGLAIGRVHVLANAEAAIPDAPLPLAEGGARLEEAVRATHAQLKALEDDTARRLGASEAAIFRAHAGLLDDPDLITTTCQLMVEGHGLAWSWHQAVERVAGSLAALGNPVLAGRAADLRDVGRRVLGQIDPSLAGGSLSDLPEGPVILVAEDLSPSDTAGLDAAKVVGLATATGGPTSHTAILARTLGIPALVAGGRGLLDLAPGTPAVLDGGAGRLHLDPGEADIGSARAWIAAQQEQRTREAALGPSPPPRATATASRSRPTSTCRTRPPSPSPRAPRASG